MFVWWQRLDLNRRPRAYESLQPIRLVNKLTVTELAELTNFSKSYISQVKDGEISPSKKFISIVADSQKERNRTERNYLALFLQSRQASETSKGTLHFYQVKLEKWYKNS